jgi:hypothetical protein
MTEELIKIRDASSKEYYDSIEIKNPQFKWVWDFGFNACHAEMIKTHVPLSVVEKLVVALKTISDMSEKMDNGCYAIGMYHENVADQALAEFKKYLESLK